MVGHGTLGGYGKTYMSFGGEEKTSGGIGMHATLCSASAKGLSRSADFVEHGVGKGGAITQKVYPDPHGIEVWRREPTCVKAVYIVSSVGFAEITGMTAPPAVRTQEEHGASVPWFETHDKDKGDVQGSDKFTGLKSVFKSPPLPKLMETDGSSSKGVVFQGKAGVTGDLLPEGEG